MSRPAEIRIEGPVIVGLGGIGTAAAYHLASRGETVLGLDPRAPGHPEGSSHGRTRLVRQAYFENAAYVPLTTASWRLWHELERLSGERLLTATGVLELGPIDDPLRLVTDTLAAGNRHGLAVEHLSAAEIRERYPAIRIDDSWEGAFEKDAGFVDPEATIRAHYRLAVDAGAEFRAESVLGIEFDERPLIRTDKGSYRADRLIVAAGPWAPQLLASTGLNIVARRKMVAHFEPVDAAPVSSGALPGFAISHDGHLFYGFPNLDGQGVKIGRHDGGDDCTPDNVDRPVHAAEITELSAVLARFLPDAAGPAIDAYTCLYTMSSDEDFIVGALPQAPNCVVATGCSGHAFKFVPVLGQILADLTLGQTPAYDIEFLSPSRSGVTDMRPMAQQPS
jgi:sarcosine oxidase